MNQFSLIQLLLSSLLALVLAAPLQAQQLLISNVQVVDPATQKISKRHVLIEGDQIVSVSLKAPKSFSGATVPGDGQYLIPGLMDMHVHSWGNSSPNGRHEMLFTGGAAARMLAFGVTGFLDLFGLEDFILAARDGQRTGGFAQDLADLYCSGPILTCTDGHGTEYGIPTRTMDSPGEAVKEVTELAAKQPDVVKLVYDNRSSRFPTMSKETMEAVVETANSFDLKTVVHIGTWQDVVDVWQAGATAVTHTPPGPMPAAMASMMQERPLYFIPTLAVHADLLQLMHKPELLQDPLLQANSDTALLAAYADTAAYSDQYKRFVRYLRNSRSQSLDNARAFVDAGALLLTGTDAGNPGTLQGFSVHREMALLAETGVEPWEILAAATTRSGEFLGIPLGVQEGDVANLVLLEANPIEDINHTLKISRVIYRGRVQE